MTTTQHDHNSPPGHGPATLGQPETIKLILERSQRPTRTVPIRRAFLQRDVSKSRSKSSGALAELVRRSGKRPLDLYLLLSAVTSGGDFSVTEWSTTWARSVGIFDETAGTAAVSRAWKVLKELNLITRARGEGGKSTITKLHEDGSGRPYTSPGEGTGDPYFQLPYEYWDKGWHNTLSLPGKAMLLIASNQRKLKFTLPQERMSDWYGVSADTAGKGIRELMNHGILVQVGDEWFDTLRTRSGRGTRPVYGLWPPFTPRALGEPTAEEEADTEVSSGVAPKE
ncbi:hypothetical protein GCM10010095_19050 [Streptomyces anthocyanicus]|uniref:hypothetical protein n=1 Tax=Streptomyces anthocyanicus TaxID=68174 RepID=UPI0016700FA3|nr:hypothetical protein [Streptomyces anthocyanicus]GGL33874.1 hypothetical protein GCM10010095_19050 [Streptomyces anthocyanicus]